MAAGYQLGTTCHDTIGNYARAACANAHGVVSGGLQSCTGHSTGDGGTVTLYLRTVGATGTTQYAAALRPTACEYPTFTDTYAPLIGAAIPVLALIWIGKRLYHIFKTEPNNV